MNLYRKVKKFCIVVNFFLIVIKNYWCDIKSEKSVNVLMLIGIRKYEKNKKKKRKKKKRNKIESIWTVECTKCIPFMFLPNKANIFLKPFALTRVVNESSCS